MIENNIILRVGCIDCGHFFDADLLALYRVRGGEFSLIGQTCTCRLTICRGTGYFVAARSMNEPLSTLTRGGNDPLNLGGLNAADLEPPTPPEPSGGRHGSVSRFVHHIATRATAA
ncbi:hypothetical protein [Croceicoccus sp. YJ47]|uniref:hypothetical protein n=1 Tax=Croceicoccus sp. YJ47 TaxID=2798724 RepID=UPI00192429E1|nr:hypothetical protein [Croceicoccus sp. YJ47]QQN73188.1 hypothetical protein JD971_09940 [Croceicoccus sp. YJ47]